MAETLCLKGWGFCHESCEKDFGVFSYSLRMVKITIFPDWLCQELGPRRKNQHNEEIVVNIKRELCGGFINVINFTSVKYDKNGEGR